MEPELDGDWTNPLFNPDNGGSSTLAPLPSSETIFSEIDTDQSGQLEIDEFMTWWKRNGGDQSQVPLLEQCFETFGAEDGIVGVSLAEFKKVIGAVAANDWLEKRSERSMVTYIG
jgi:Ca2+-binding EF-hand superfamily protein